MAYAMAKVVAFLCLALLLVHVDSARTLKQVNGDSSTMTAGTFTTESTVEESGGQGTPPAAETVPAPDVEYNYNNDSAPTGTTTSESPNQGFYLPDQGNTEQFSDSGKLSPPAETTDSFAQEDTVEEGHLWENVDDAGDSAASFADDKFLGSDGFSTEDVDTDTSPESFASEGILVADPQGSDASDDSKYTFDATTEDPTYPTDSTEDASELTLAEANPQFEYDSGSPSTIETADETFEFDESKPQYFGP